MQTIAGVDLPDTPLARQAEEFARDHYPPFLLGHCQRTYVFGKLATEAAGLRVHGELAYVAAVLHDLGLTDAHADGRRFEVSGAGAARAWASGAGLSDGDAQVIWDAIALHTSAGIADVRSPECALVFWGAGVDVAGFGLEQFPPDAVAAVLDALPRRGFTPAFLEVVEAAASRAPGAYALTWLSATASRCGGSPLMTSEDTLRRDPFDPS